MVPTAILVLLWVLLIINLLIGSKLTDLGIAPRTFPFGLIGIFIAPFIHASIAHMGANTVPFFFTSAIINGTRGTAHFLLLSASIAVSSGLMVWGFGRSDTTHVGASGVIFGYVGFLCVAAALQRNFTNVAIAFVVLFLYGSMLFGVFPTDEKVSWEGHLFGFVAGGLISYVYTINVDVKEQVDKMVDDIVSGGTENERRPILGRDDDEV